MAAAKMPITTVDWEQYLRDRNEELRAREAGEKSPPLPDRSPGSPLYAGPYPETPEELAFIKKRDAAVRAAYDADGRNAKASAEADAENERQRQYSRDNGVPLPGDPDYDPKAQYPRPLSIWEYMRNYVKYGGR